MALTEDALDGMALTSDAESEVYSVLLARARKKTGKIPAEPIVRHVLAIVPADEWPVRSEAMDAVLRRFVSVKEDELKVSEPPPGGCMLGPYTTRRKGSKARPYRTVLHALDPLSASCDCPDFLKNSLGLCKHVLCACEHVHSRGRGAALAAREQAQAPAEGRSGPRWDPIRPLVGVGDWLDRVSFVPSAGARGKAREREEQIRSRWFVEEKSGSFRIKKVPTAAERRLELLEDLATLQPSREDRQCPDPAPLEAHRR